MTFVKLDRAVMGTKFKNNPRSMARTRKRLKIIIIGHRDFLSYLILSCFDKIVVLNKIGHPVTGVTDNLLPKINGHLSGPSLPKLVYHLYSYQTKLRQCNLPALELSRRHKGNLFHGSEIKHIAREPPSTIIDRLALMCEV